MPVRSICSGFKYVHQSWDVVAVYAMILMHSTKKRVPGRDSPICYFPHGWRIETNRTTTTATIFLDCERIGQHCVLDAIRHMHRLVWSPPNAATKQNTVILRQQQPQSSPSRTIEVCISSVAALHMGGHRTERTANMYQKQRCCRIRVCQCARVCVCASVCSDCGAIRAQTKKVCVHNWQDDTVGAYINFTANKTAQF